MRFPKRLPYTVIVAHLSELSTVTVNASFGVYCQSSLPFVVLGFDVSVKSSGSSPEIGSLTTAFGSNVLTNGTGSAPASYGVSYCSSGDGASPSTYLVPKYDPLNMGTLANQTTFDMSDRWSFEYTYPEDARPVISSGSYKAFILIFKKSSHVNLVSANIAFRAYR